jgi:hypothetical protein
MLNPNQLLKTPFIILLFISTGLYAQKKENYFADSVTVIVHPVYNNVSGIHRWLFGENYRKEWATAVKLPVIKISTVYGGLTPIREGGGMQSKSLRLRDKDGVEWVLRSVEKTPDKLLPEGLRGTFALDWIDDALSGQHPYSALVVPPLAEAAKVPHAHPVIGMVADDPAFGEFRKVFAGIVCLLEEREPTGESDNTIKMLNNLVKDNDNRFDKETFLRARMLDLLIGDWDRHEDQWRWAYKKDGKNKFYTSVPRDRDQVFHLTEGVFPSIASASWLDPILDNFDGKIPRVKYSLYKTRYVQPYPDGQFAYDDWMRIVHEFVKAETDEVLETSLKQLPPPDYAMRHDELYKKLKERRDAIPAAMDEYYRFINKIVDIRLSDKNEQVTFSDAPGNNLRLVVKKLNKSEKAKDVIMDVTYRSDITQEIRLFLSDGDDQVEVNNHSPVKLRIVGGYDDKTYKIEGSATKIKLYDKPDSIHLSGDLSKLSIHLSRDTSNKSFIPTNRYDVWMPLATAAINVDDGFLLGLGFKYTNQQGFRKFPYSNMQQVMITHSFATDAFRIKYNGEWIRAIGKADFIMQANIQAPDNTMNFFGLGNETPLDKTGDYHRYYRARFNTYQFDPALRWHADSVSTFSIGPSIQLYTFDTNDNAGRFINNSSLIHSYDSTTVNKNKANLGLVMNYTSNHRNNPILPSKGYYLQIAVDGYTGLNSYSRGYLQIRPEFTFYQSLSANNHLVLSDRIGGGITIGNPAFYQALFLGGQGNLLGYLQNRFAGQHLLYNNLQARLKLTSIASYILPGELGLSGFFDSGRVWVNGEHSDKWHTGTGGGFYFVPAGLTIVQILAGHSSEGWYPYISLNFRI